MGLKTQNKDQAKRIDKLEKKLVMLQNTTSSPPLTRANNKVNRFSSKSLALNKGISRYTFIRVGNNQLELPVISVNQFWTKISPTPLFSGDSSAV